MVSDVMQKEKLSKWSASSACPLFARRQQKGLIGVAN
jgi:hypothetical protein